MTTPAIPTTLPWFFSSGDNGGLITEADGTTIMYVTATVNTTAHRDLFKNLSHMVHAANQLPRLQAELEQAKAASWASVAGQIRTNMLTAEVAAPQRDLMLALLDSLDTYAQDIILKPARPDQQRAELEAARIQAERQSLVASKVAARLEGQPDQLQRTLRAVRAMIDGTQPKDLPGAVMAIDAALAPTPAPAPAVAVTWAPCNPACDYEYGGPTATCNCEAAKAAKAAA